MRDWRKIKRNTKRKRAGCLNRYEFAYTGRNVVNTALTTFKKVAPSLMETATNQVDKAADKNDKTSHISGGKEFERIARKILRPLIDELYKTPFRLLRNFGQEKI